MSKDMNTHNNTKELSLPHNHGTHPEAMVEIISHTEDFTTVSNIFRLINDGTRLRLFWILCHCEECVINLSAMMNMSSPALSHHLKLLKEAGLIISYREGKEVYYKAADTTQVHHLHHMIEAQMDISCPR